MKIYILLHEQDTDSSWGGSAAPYLDKESARAAMRKELEETAKSWGYNSRDHHDEDECSCSDNSAVLRDGINAEHWSIKEFELDVRVAVEVMGGLVTDVFANSDLMVDVFDLDVSDFPDEGEPEAVDKRKVELITLSKTPGWRRVY